VNAALFLYGPRLSSSQFNGHPQGSVLGLSLQHVYASELSFIRTADDVLGQLYAENIQTYLPCVTCNAIATFRAMTVATDNLVTLMNCRI